MKQPSKRRRRINHPKPGTLVSTAFGFVWYPLDWYHVRCACDTCAVGRARERGKERSR